MANIIQSIEAHKLFKGYAMKAVKSFKVNGKNVLGGNLYYNNRLIAFVREDNINSNIKDKTQFKHFSKQCTKLPYSNYHSISIPITAEVMCIDMLNYINATKKFKRLCKTHIVIITTACKNNTYIKFNRKYIPEAPYNHREQLNQKYGERLIEIVNDRFL